MTADSLDRTLVRARITGECGGDETFPVRAQGALQQLNPVRRLWGRAPRAHGKSY